MVIGIDIDDTTVVTVESMVKYGDKYDTEVLNREAKKDNLGRIKDRYYMKALYGWTEEEKFAFFDMYYKNVLEECYPLPNASEIINKLKQEGNEIIFITARLTNIKNCETENITKETFRKYNIPYDKLIMNVDDKLKFCKENDVEVFIEDSYETCKSLQENGIKAYLMTTKMNRNIVDDKIERVSSWDEVYEKITNLK
ncbi:MAG: hypothetical protein IKJ36_00820 [Clostridia bacterium]|nr:hypothetical protein [Clostridia bacterium]